VPIVTDTWVAGVSSVGADLRGEINPDGLPTNARFEYIPDAAFQANLSSVPPQDPFAGAVVTPVGGKAIGEGSAPVALAQRVGGLKAGGSYHFRVAATNSAGTTLGPARAFTIRQPGEISLLLDGRAWEMVSPVDKNGGEIQDPGGVFGGGVWQAAEAGGAVTYSSLSSFGNGEGAPGASQYVSRRGSGGWGTENVTTAAPAGTFELGSDGVTYQLFSGDLARGIVLDPQRCETAPCPRRYLLRQSSTGSLSASPAAADLTLAGADADLSHVVLSTEGNLYAWSGGALTLLNLLPGETQGAPGATLAAQGANSISANGTRTYFESEGNLYLRDGSETVQVDEGVGGGGTFQAATADGGVAFFTKAEHLYRYVVASGVATDLTPAGGVVGMLGASADGTYLYYLTAAGLFLQHGAAEPIQVADAADASNYPPSTGTSRVAANGNLAFLSSAALSEFDSGGFSEVYLYSPAAAGLTCASCNPSGARPLGASTIPGAVANGSRPEATRLYKPRVLSSAGNRIFFDSSDALVLADTNNRPDVYEWEAQGLGSCSKAGGCIGLVSDGRAENGAVFLDASGEGADAFFVTDGSLVGADPGAGDVYDARIGGGFPEPVSPSPCEADNCQVLPDEPADPGLGTDFLRSEGNPPVKFPKAKRHHRKRHHKARKHRKHHPGRHRGGHRG
jgi:hypothetical protein